jgi:fucose permease
MRRPPVHLVLAIGAFVALGWHDGILGVVWPDARRSLDRPVSSLGILLVALTVGYVVTSLATGWLAARLGTGRLLVAAEVIAVTGAALAAWSPAWAVLVVAIAVIGVSAGLVDTGINAYVAVNHGVRPMALLHAGFGAGAASSPVLVAWLLHAGGSWRLAYAGLLAGHAVVAVVAVVLARSFSGRGAEEEVPEVVELARRRTAVAVGVLLFTVYVGVELTAGQWAYTLFTEERGLSRGGAAVLVTAYWGALGGGRLLTALAGRRVPPIRVLQGSMVLAVAAAAVLWWDPGGSGGLALPVLGFALAPVFPLLVTLTPARLGAERATGVIGMQLAASAVGGALIPAAGGWLAGAHGLEVLAPYLVVVAAVMGGVFLLLERVAPAAARRAPLS